MIVLFNPWSTPSPKKPLPMSLLALGSMLEGEPTTASSTATSKPEPVAKIARGGAKTPHHRGGGHGDAGPAAALGGDALPRS